MGAFGEKLRKQREQRGLALEAISNTTKISTRMLRAIEDEHFDQLPGGVFNKGFVRAYARQVGLDEEEAVADYLTALRESQIRQQSILPDFRAPLGRPDTTATPALPGNGQRPRGASELQDRVSQDRLTQDHSKPDRPNQGRQDQDRPKQDRRKKEEDRRHSQPSLPSSPTVTDPSMAVPEHAPNNAEPSAQATPEPSAQIPWGKLAAALLLITLILAFWNLRRHTQPKAAPLPAASSQQQSSAPASAAVSTSASTAPTISANSLTSGEPSSTTTLSSGSISPGPISSAASSTKPAPTLPAPAASSNQTASSAATPTNPPPAKSKTPAAEPKPPATFTVLIRAEENTWVSIVADGKPVAEETLIAPAHTSVRATHEVYVRAGNAAGVSFQLNGKDIPAQGNEGEVKAYIFNATGIHVEPPQAPVPNR